MSSAFTNQLLFVSRHFAQSQDIPLNDILDANRNIIGIRLWQWEVILGHQQKDFLTLTAHDEEVDLLVTLMRIPTVMKLRHLTGSLRSARNVLEREHPSFRARVFLVALFDHLERQFCPFL